MKKLLFILFFPCAIQAQDCMDCSNNKVVTDFKAGQEIYDSSTFAACSWVVQIAAYKDLIPAPGGVWVKYEANLYKYYLPYIFAYKEDAEIALERARKAYPEAFISKLYGFMVMKKRNTSWK